jgi:hypothetical protein
MNYKGLFTPHHIAMLADWLHEKGALCAELYIPHGGSTGWYETVRSLAELKKVVAEIRTGEIEITIWKNHTQAEFESDDPFVYDLKWIYSHADEVMYFSVHKNRNSSASYNSDPEKYSKDIEEWAS